MTNIAHSAVRSWLGVPFATADRFLRPALLPFDPDLPYDEKGPAPFQAGDAGWLEADNGTSEDCLNLNVWAPQSTAEHPLPVVIYLYGGGFERGANTQPTSNVSGLAATGRVVGISLNYRLGPFGFLSLSQYGGALGEASNLGLQDIITALHWVKENITRFGGDPSNVTVVGHSAGAYLTMALLGAPTADGLYHRLAAFSGGASRIVPAWWAEELASRLLTQLGIQDDPKKLFKLDASLLAETLVAISPRDIGERHGIDNTTIGVVNDRYQPGAILRDTPLRALESGRHRDIDILLSTATNEADWWVINTLETFDPRTTDHVVNELATHSRIPRSHAQRIVDAYAVEGRTPAETRAAIFTDYFFTLPATRATLAHAAVGGKAYRLAVGPVEGAPAVHGTEMYGIVGQEKPGRSDEQAIRDTLVRDALLDFATGNHAKLWPVVTEEPTAHGIGKMPYDATAHAVEVLRTFEGVERT
ncbi:carboxylesterase family protein [Rhizobium sp. 2YAF20]|uniref:carboxylesterase family protein n=1 Tax=Rhizobium sp. 2YAF20 TaxID=3233027 RepID=UPI003F9A8E7E